MRWQLVARIVDLSLSAVASISGFVLVTMMLHVAADVAVRVMTGTSLNGTFTYVTALYMPVVICLPLALVDQRGTQISLTYVTDLLPQRERRRYVRFTLICSAAVFAVVAWASLGEAMTQYRTDNFLVGNGGAIFRTWYGYFALPLGYGLASAYLLLSFLRGVLPNEPS